MNLLKKPKLLKKKEEIPVALIKVQKTGVSFGRKGLLLKKMTSSLNQSRSSMILMLRILLDVYINIITYVRSTSPCLLSPSRTRSRTHRHLSRWWRRQRKRISLSSLHQRHRKHAPKESRLRRHRLVRDPVLPRRWTLLPDPPLHWFLQGHRDGLREMPDDQVEDGGQLLLKWSTNLIIFWFPDCFDEPFEKTETVKKERRNSCCPDKSAKNGCKLRTKGIVTQKNN